METAMEAVKNGDTSINKAAVMYNVPCTSLTVKWESCAWDPGPK